MSDLYRDVIRVRADDSRILAGGIKDGMFAFGRTSEKIIVRDDNGSPTPVYYEIGGGGDSLWESTGSRLTPTSTETGVYFNYNNNEEFVALYAGEGGSVLEGDNVITRANVSFSNISYGTLDFIADSNSGIRHSSNSGSNTHRFYKSLGEVSEKLQATIDDNGMNIKADGAYMIGGVPLNIVSDFIDLFDTPLSYSGQGLKAVRVNTGANALEFYTPTYNSLTDRPSQITHEPTGFLDPAEVEVIGDLVTRTVTISGDGSLAYVDNVPTDIDGRIIPWVSPAHDATYPGAKQIYLQSDGVTTEWSTGVFDFRKVQIAIGIINRTTGAVEFYQREIHGFIGWEDHKNQHFGIGTQHLSGGDESTIVLNSTTAANRRPTVSASSDLDEDNPFIVDGVTGNYTWMRIGTNGAEWVTGNADIVNLSGNQPYYNNGTGQTLLANNRSMCVYELENPALDSHDRIFVQGQAQFNDNTAALGDTPASLNLDGFNASELVFVRKYVIRYSGGNWTIAAKVSILGTKVSQISFPSGNYLSSVTTDATLTGSGPAADPLSVASSPKLTTARTISGVSFDGTANITLTAADVGAESALGNPATNGFILSSTTAGVRSWIAQTWLPAASTGGVYYGTAGGQSIGVGVQPELWQNVFNAVQVGMTAAFFGTPATNAAYFTNNVYFNASWNSLTTGYASRMGFDTNGNIDIRTSNNTAAAKNITMDFAGLGFLMKPREGAFCIAEKTAPAATANYHSIYATTDGLYSINDSSESFLLSIFTPTSAATTNYLAWSPNVAKYNSIRILSNVDGATSECFFEARNTGGGSTYSLIVGTASKNDSQAEKCFIYSTGDNISLIPKGVSVAKVMSTGELQINNTTETIAAPINGAKIYAKDFAAGNATMYLRDEAGDKPICASGSFTVTLQNVTTTVTGTATWQMSGKEVSITIPELSGTSTSNIGFNLIGVPSYLYPPSECRCGCVIVIQEGVTCAASVIVHPSDNSGGIRFFKHIVSGSAVIVDHLAWTASTAKTVPRTTITYTLA